MLRWRILRQLCKPGKWAEFRRIPHRGHSTDTNLRRGCWWPGRARQATIGTGLIPWTGSGRRRGSSGKGTMDSYPIATKTKLGAGNTPETPGKPIRRKFGSLRAELRKCTWKVMPLSLKTGREFLKIGGNNQTDSALSKINTPETLKSFKT